MTRAPQPRPASDIADLIAKLENAMEGSHALDCEIYRAVHEYARNWLPDFPPGGLPQYTRSIDAAFTLTLEGFAAQFSVGLGAPSPACFAEVWDETTDETHPSFEASAPTPALALCIAALRARQAAS